MVPALRIDSPRSRCASIQSQKSKVQKSKVPNKYGLQSCGNLGLWILDFDLCHSLGALDFGFWILDFATGCVFFADA
jgi:hypothetical protein